MNNQDDLPPPAYSEQEFDQKTAHALTLSAHHPQNNRQDEDDWEEWDEAVFEANATAARAANQGSSASSGSSSVDRRPSSSRRPLPVPGRPSSGLPPVQPLRIHKRNKSSGDASQTPSKSQEAASSWVQKGAKHQPSELDEPQNDVSPPPPFQAIETPSDNIITLNYNAADSLPPSPLMPTIPEQQSPHTPQHAQPFPSQTYPQQTYNYQTPTQQSYSSLPFSQPDPMHIQPNPVVNIYPHRVATPPSAPARASPSHLYQQQSTTPRTYTPPQQPQQAHKPHFAPSMTTSISSFQSRVAPSPFEPPQVLTFDPSAFYNAAVSGHVPTSLAASSRPRQSQYVPSGTHSSNYTPSAHQPRVIQTNLQPPVQNASIRPMQSLTPLRPQTTYNLQMQSIPPSSGWNSSTGTTPHRWATSEPDFHGT